MTTRGWSMPEHDSVSAHSIPARQSVFCVRVRPMLCSVAGALLAVAAVFLSGALFAVEAQEVKPRLGPYAGIRAGIADPPPSLRNKYGRNVFRGFKKTTRAFKSYRRLNRTLSLGNRVGQGPLSVRKLALRRSGGRYRQARRRIIFPNLRLYDRRGVEITVAPPARAGRDRERETRVVIPESAKTRLHIVSEELGKNGLIDGQRFSRGVPAEARRKRLLVVRGGGRSS